jgi:hypothetical protein
MIVSESADQKVIEWNFVEAFLAEFNAIATVFLLKRCWNRTPRCSIIFHGIRGSRAAINLLHSHSPSGLVYTIGREIASLFGNAPDFLKRIGVLGTSCGRPSDWRLRRLESIRGRFTRNGYLGTQAESSHVLCSGRPQSGSVTASRAHKTFKWAGCNGIAGLPPEVLGPRGRYLTGLAEPCGALPRKCLSIYLLCSGRQAPMLFSRIPVPDGTKAFVNTTFVLGDLNGTMLRSDVDSSIERLSRLLA